MNYKNEVYTVEFFNNRMGFKLAEHSTEKYVYISEFYTDENSEPLEAKKSNKIKIGDFLIKVNKKEVTKKNYKKISEYMTEKPNILEFQSIPTYRCSFLKLIDNPKYSEKYRLFFSHKWKPEFLNRLLFLIDFHKYIATENETEKFELSVSNAKKYLLKSSSHSINISILKSEIGEIDNYSDYSQTLYQIVYAGLKAETYSLFCTSECYYSIYYQLDDIIDNRRYYDYFLIYCLTTNCHTELCLYRHIKVELFSLFEEENKEFFLLKIKELLSKYYDFILSSSITNSITFPSYDKMTNEL